VESARQTITALNPDVSVIGHETRLTKDNALDLIAGYDLVLDGTDNFATRYLINDACVKHETNWIYGAAVSSYGTTMTILPDETPCLRCVFDEMPDAGSSPTCDTAGVIMPIIATVSATQVTEALKLLVGDTDSLHRSLLQFDVWANDRQRIKLGEPNPDCRCCAKREFEFLDAEAGEFAAVLCGRDAVQIGGGGPLDLARLATNLGTLADVKQNEYLLRFSIDGREITVFADGRAIVKGTDDISTARSIYARYVGT